MENALMNAGKTPLLYMEHILIPITKNMRLK